MIRNIFKLFTRLNLLNYSTITMNNIFLKPLQQNPKRFKRIMFLKQMFEEDGYEIKIAGGAVRDILSGKEPTDIDFATTSTPDKTLEIMKRREDVLRIIVTPKGQSHGTVTAKFKETDKLEFHKKQKLDYNVTKMPEQPKYDEESPFEVTTLRCDKTTDGRHAEVEFLTDWKIDAERRDLTINAMFLALDGTLVDYYNGQQDLKAGVIRFVGDADKRIKEDYLRILRFFRFWSRYGKQDPDDETLQTIKNNLDGLASISGERLWSESKKILSYLPFHKTLKLMLDLGVYEQLGLKDPSLNHSEYVRLALTELKSVEENIAKFKESFANNDKETTEFMPVVAFASIIQSELMFETAYARLKFSNLERDFIKFVVDNRHDTNLTLQQIKKQLALAPPPEVANMRRKLKAFLIYKGVLGIIEDLQNWQVPTFPLNGKIVAQELMLVKAPVNKIKLVLQALRADWAESDYSLNREELVEKIQSKVEEVN